VMSEALTLPYWFWGIVCAAFSALVLLGGLWLFIKPGKPGRTAHRAGLAAAA
jgi:hypothetical protein